MWNPTSSPGPSRPSLRESAPLNTWPARWVGRWNTRESRCRWPIRSLKEIVLWWGHEVFESLSCSTNIFLDNCMTFLSPYNIHFPAHWWCLNLGVLAVPVVEYVNIFLVKVRMLAGYILFLKSLRPPTLPVKSQVALPLGSVALCLWTKKTPERATDKSKIPKPGRFLSANAKVWKNWT